jgi:mannitol/fructose-specific phosphotransferase system IIA component (Ntr-type)
MSKDATLMNKILPLIKEKAFLEALSKQKDRKEIKNLFATKSIDIPEGFAKSLANTKSTQKIIDTIGYVKEYEGLKRLEKILKTPNMKYA